MPLVTRPRALLALLLAVGALIGAERLRPRHDVASSSVPSSAVDPIVTPGSDPVVVHVAGAVKRPGVYTLHVGDRVRDAVAAAGGTGSRADVAAVNLASLIEDGQQIVVPQRPRGQARAGAPAGTSSPSAAPAPAPVNINQADAAGLDTLPGVGPSTAARIIGWRTEHGRFRTVDDLLAVPGIGPARVEAIRPLVTT